jgi:predicted DNA-binding protein with PD1-like motif
MRSLALASILALILADTALAQDQAATPEYAARTDPRPGMAPGLKTTELAPKIRTFQLVFAKGDEVVAGLAEFADKQHLTNAHFTAIGAFDKAVIGWYDPDKRAYKLARLNEEMEVTSFVGNISRDRDGKPVVHVHGVVSLLRNGAVQAGHFMEGHVSLTMQLYLEDAS